MNSFVFRLISFLFFINSFISSFQNTYASAEAYRQIPDEDTITTSALTQKLTQCSPSSSILLQGRFRKIESKDPIRNPIFSGITGTTYKRLHSESSTSFIDSAECSVLDAARVAQIKKDFVIALSDGYGGHLDAEEDRAIYHFAQSTVDMATQFLIQPEFDHPKNLKKRLPKLIQIIQKKAQEMMTPGFSTVDSSLTAGRVYLQSDGTYRYLGFNIGKGAVIVVSAEERLGWKTLRTLAHPHHGPGFIGVQSFKAGPDSSSEVEYIDETNIPSDSVLLALSGGALEFLETQKIQKAEKDFSVIQPEPILAELNRSSTQVLPRLVIQQLKEVTLENEKRTIQDASPPGLRGLKLRSAIGDDYTVFGVLLQRDYEVSKSLRYDPKPLVPPRKLEFLKNARVSPRLSYFSNASSELCTFLEYLRKEYGNQVEQRRLLSSNNILWNFIFLYRAELERYPYDKVVWEQIDSAPHSVFNCGGVYQEFMSDPWSISREAFTDLIRDPSYFTRFTGRSSLKNLKF